MQIRETGVLEHSDIFLCSASAKAQELLFYPLCVGHYFCDETYLLRRGRFDSFLIIYMVSGNGFVMHHGARVPLPTGAFALLDCYEPQCYGSDGPCEILWLHFDGPMARKTYGAVAQKPVITLRDPATARHNLVRIHSAFSEGGHIPECYISKYINAILTEFLGAGEGTGAPAHESIHEIRAYIAQHPDMDLDVAALAGMVNLSVYHFSRLFKQETGCSPHRYIMRTRVSAAQYYLTRTDLSVTEIAERVGFSDVSNFCVCFKKLVGVTPGRYRTDNGIADR